MVPFRAIVQETWVKHPKSWADFLELLLNSWMGLLVLLHYFSICVLYTVINLISWLITLFVAQLFQMFSPMRQVQSTPADPEAAGGPEQVVTSRSVPLPPVPPGEETASLNELDLDLGLDLELPVEIAQVYAVQSSAVKWILKTSTDMDNIGAAAGILPEIEWPAEDNVDVVFKRLKSHFHACFDPKGHILPIAQAGATACLKAMCCFDVEQDLKNLFHLPPSGYISSGLDRSFYYSMIPDQGFLTISCAVDICYAKLDMASVPLYDCMWMACMFTYRLYNGDNIPGFVDLVIGFINTCLDSKAPTRLAADCVLLAGMLICVQINCRDLA